MKKFDYLVWVLVFFNVTYYGCVEPFDISSELEQAEPVLVVEATLTNELQRQRILLGRSSGFEVVNELDSIYDASYPIRPRDTSYVVERDARITIEDSQGNQYAFSESTPGTYTSDFEFSALQGVSYTLNIETASGLRYRSTPEHFEAVAEIENVSIARGNNEQGSEGVYVYVDGSSTNATSNFYRYTYLETFKIIAPSWQPEDFVLTNYDPCALPVITYDLEIVLRDNEEGKVCYNTFASTEIVQTSTSGLSQNRVERFPVRFIDRNNYIISHRYSILVKQYVQSPGAYGYYQSLKSFSSSDNIFSAVQPGFIEGNIRATNSEDANVLGYFEVASVSEKRVFFDYDDLFPEEALPEYPVSCDVMGPPLDHPSYCISDGLVAWNCPQSIVEAVNVGLIAYYGLNDENIGACPGPYTVTRRACGDCTVIGNSDIPEFWVE